MAKSRNLVRILEIIEGLIASYNMSLKDRKRFMTSIMRGFIVKAPKTPGAFTEAEVRERLPGRIPVPEPGEFEA